MLRHFIFVLYLNINYVSIYLHLNNFIITLIDLQKLN